MAKSNNKENKHPKDEIKYIVDDNGNIRKITDLVVKDYDEKASIESYRRRFKGKRSDNVVINKLKDWLFDNLKLETGRGIIIDLLGVSKYDEIADYLNTETISDTNNSASISDISDCIDIEEFITLPNDIKQTWFMIRGKSELIGNANTMSSLKLMFGEESETFKRIKKILVRKQTLFESLFLPPEEPFRGMVTSDMIKLSTK